MDITVSGCNVAVADFDTRLVAVKSGSGDWQVIGRHGAGPGEYEQPGRVTYQPSGTLVIYDLSLRRLVRIDRDGKAVGPPVVLRIPYRHPTGGMILAIDDSTVADYWFGARVPWRPISDSALSLIPLVTRVTRDGQPRGGWGQASVPPIGSLPSALWQINAGAMAVGDGKLFALRRSSAVLEEYELSDGILARTDSLDPLEARSLYDEHDEGMAGAVAAIGGGRLAVILRRPRGGDREVYPRERLVVLDSVRRVIAAYDLTTRGNHLAFVGGAYLFALGMADSSRADVGDQVIDLLQLPGFDPTDRCGWTTPK